MDARKSAYTLVAQDDSHQAQNGNGGPNANDEIGRGIVLLAPIDSDRLCNGRFQHLDLWVIG
jgi:hypothetical protein